MKHVRGCPKVNFGRPCSHGAAHSSPTSSQIAGFRRVPSAYGIAIVALDLLALLGLCVAALSATLGDIEGLSDNGSGGCTRLIVLSLNCAAEGVEAGFI